MRRLGGYYAAISDIGGAAVDFTLLTNNEMVVYVKSTGSDTTGDGTISNPYLTVGRALLDCPSYWYTSSGSVTTRCVFRVRIIAPYASCPHFTFRGAITARNCVPVILIEAWDTVYPSATFNTLTDPRWTNTAGPFTSTAAAAYAVSRPSYTLPGGSIAADDDYVGSFARIFNAAGTTELARGVVVHSVAATQQIVIQTAGTYAPTAGEIIRICTPSVSFPAGTSRLFCDNASVNFNAINFEVNAFLTMGCFSGTTMNFMQCRMELNGEQFALDAGSRALTIRNPTALVNATGVAFGYPASEATIPGGGVLYNYANNSRCTMFPFQLLAGGCVMGIVAGGNGGVQTSVASAIHLGENACIKGVIDTTGTGVAVPSAALTINFGGTATSPTLFIRRANLTGPLIRLINAQIVPTPDTTAYIAVNNGTSAEPVLQALSNVQQYNTLRIDKALAAFGATAGLVATAVRDSSIIVDPASTQNGTGGDLQAGTNAALTYAQVNALLNDRDTDTQALASVRIA